MLDEEGWFDEEGYGVRRGGWMRVRRGRLDEEGWLDEGKEGWLDEDSSIVAV